MTARPASNDLVTAIGASQQNVSKHLQVLLDAGIVGKPRTGTTSIYRIVDEGVFGLCETVCGTIERQLVELGSLLAQVGNGVNADKEGSR